MSVLCALHFVALKCWTEHQLLSTSNPLAEAEICYVLFFYICVPFPILKQIKLIVFTYIIKCFNTLFRLQWGQCNPTSTTYMYKERKVQLFLCGRHRENEIVSVTVRVRRDEIWNWKLAAILMFGLSSKVSCPWLYKQNILKVLLEAWEDMTRDRTRF